MGRPKKTKDIEEVKNITDAEIAEDVKTDELTKKNKETNKLKEEPEINNNNTEYYLDSYLGFTEKNIDDNTDVPVENNTDGQLYYISQSTGESITWEFPKERNFMKVSELKTMLSKNKKFFVENWVLIPYSVIKYLGIENLYKYVYLLDDIDNLFKLPSDEMISKIEQMSKTMQKNVMQIAINGIDDGVIDSIKNIRALESYFDISFL